MRAFVATIFLVVVLLPGVGRAEGPSFQDGLPAYEAKDFPRAMAIWLPLAEAGDAEAQYRVGRLYDRGEGVKKDPKSAVQWYRRSAEQGLADAQHNLAVMYELGEGVAKSDYTAVEWYTKAAEQGETEVQVRLGKKFMYGHGVWANFEKADYWFREAAKNGSDEALLGLGLLWEEKDPAASHSWLKMASQQGNRAARLYLFFSGSNDAPFAQIISDMFCVFVIGDLLKMKTDTCTKQWEARQ